MNYKRTCYDKYIKRIIDFILSLFAVIVLSPILVVIAILVKVKLGSPVIFKQKRPGLNEKIFTMYKFRTMTDERDEKGDLLPDEVRLTKLGKSLRTTSLDELPELFNILKGDMAIVGPRPLLVQYLPLYGSEQRQRHCVRPGITGYAQANGRNFLSWDKKFEFDIYYVNNLNLKLDIQILIKTIIIVLKKEGINNEGSETTEPFKGE